jgi:hypothetical protein
VTIHAVRCKLLPDAYDLWAREKLYVFSHARSFIRSLTHSLTRSLQSQTSFRVLAIILVFYQILSSESFHFEVEELYVK